MIKSAKDKTREPWQSCIAKGHDIGIKVIHARISVKGP